MPWSCSICNTNLRGCHGNKCDKCYNRLKYLDNKKKGLCQVCKKPSESNKSCCLPCQIQRNAYVSGVSLNDRKQLFIKQQGVCAICHKSIEIISSCVDHDHKTGKIRGLLCVTCNTRIGYIESDWIELAKQYLAKHETLDNAA